MFLFKISNPFSNSKILNEKSSIDLMKLCEFSEQQEWRLVYRATDHGFGFEDFHGRCSGQKKCLTIIKAEGGNIFGGYTGNAWNKEAKYMPDDNAFLSSLINKENTPLKMICTEPGKAVVGQRGPFIQVYGNNGVVGSSSLALRSDSNTYADSYSNLGGIYKHPTYPFESKEAKEFMAGSFRFKTIDIEVYCKL